MICAPVFTFIFIHIHLPEQRTLNLSYRSIQIRALVKSMLYATLLKSHSFTFIIHVIKHLDKLRLLIIALLSRFIHRGSCSKSPRSIQISSICCSYFIEISTLLLLFFPKMLPFQWRQKCCFDELLMALLSSSTHKDWCPYSVSLELCFFFHFFYIRVLNNFAALHQLAIILHCMRLTGCVRLGTCTYVQNPPSVYYHPFDHSSYAVAYLSPSHSSTNRRLVNMTVFQQITKISSSYTFYYHCTKCHIYSHAYIYKHVLAHWQV